GRLGLAADGRRHAIVPGAAVGFRLAGLESLPMTLGGFAAGPVVALLAGLVSRATIQREDTSLAAFYLISLALGVLLVSLKGTSVDLMHVLFGTVLALDDDALTMIGAIASVSLVALAVIWRPLVAECLDPGFLRSVSRAGQPVHLIFLALVVLNLVGGFQALGTLMAVGLMMLPAAAARFWVRSLEAVTGLAVLIGVASSYLGLLVSYHREVASGPSIILVAGVAYIVSSSLEAVTGLAVLIGVASSYLGLLVSYHLEVASGPSIILVAGVAYIVSLVLAPRGIVFSRTQP